MNAKIVSISVVSLAVMALAFICLRTKEPQVADVVPVSAAGGVESAPKNVPSGGRSVSLVQSGPPPAPSQSLAPQQLMYEKAKRIFESLRFVTNPLQLIQTCNGIQDDLVLMLETLPHEDALWDWAMDQAEACIQVPQPFSNSNKLRERVAQAAPKHPRVLELIGLHYYRSGEHDKAIKYLEDAVAHRESFNALEALSETKLFLGRRLRERGDVDSGSRLLIEAEGAALRALTVANSTTAPFVMHKLARIQLALGRDQKAIEWADKSMEVMRSGWNSEQQALQGPEIYVVVGGIYYRASQQSVGLAYMDQGIRLAVPDARMRLEQLKASILEDAG